MTFEEERDTVNRSWDFYDYAVVGIELFKLELIEVNRAEITFDDTHSDRAIKYKIDTLYSKD